MTEKDLFAAFCHIGHRKDKWNPKMAPYIYGTQKGIHIVDLTKTMEHLDALSKELKGLQDSGKTILFVSTKQQSIPLVEEIGRQLGQPVVTKKWIPGLLTNWNTIKKRIRYYLDLQQSFKTGDIEKYTKKEQMSLRKQLAKLDTALSGVANMTDTPDAMFIVDGVRDHVALLEARKLKIPVYGICDTNANPDEFTMFVPGNDDAVKSIMTILDTILKSISGKSLTTGLSEPTKEETPEAESEPAALAA